MNCAIIENDAVFSEKLKAELRSLPDIAEVSVWHSGEEFWRDPQKQKMDLCFVDLGLPGISGVELIGLLRAEGFSVPCIVISALSDEETIVNAIEAGASGYIWKGDLRSLGEVVQTIQEGGAIISPSIAVRLIQALRKRSPAQALSDLLSAREIQVFQSIAEGMTPRQVAALLGTTEGTVRNQIKSIYKKTQVNNRVDLMKAAVKYGLLRGSGE